MTGRYGRTELYISRLPVRSQMGGRCVPCTWLYAMEMLGLLTNQPVVQLSQLFYTSPVPRENYHAVCAEHLWPKTLSYGPAQWLDGITDYNRQQYIEGVQPDAICLTDAPNAVLLELGGIEMDFEHFTAAAYIAACKAAIDLGYVLHLNVYPSHAEVVWDYDDAGVFGLDSRSSNPMPEQHDWNYVVTHGINTVFKRVAFSGIKTPHRINPYMPNNNVSLVQAMRAHPAATAAIRAKLNTLTAMAAADITQLWALVDALPFSQDVGYLASMVNALVLDATPVIITQTGNAALVAAMQSDLSTWRANMVTQVQIDNLRTQVNSLIADAATPPIPPAGGAAWQVPPAASGVDTQGHVWSLGAASQYGKVILRDGVQFALGQATLIDFRNGTVKVQNNAGQWYTPNATGWAATGAP